MGEEQYKGLLFLVSGLSLFIIMLLSLRLISHRRGQKKPEGKESIWTGPENLKVVDIITETPNVKSFKLVRANGKSFPPFRGGQFLSFQIDSDPSITRSYSLSSLEQNKNIVQISVKHLPNGRGSTWFHKLKKGDKIKAFAPSGNFVDKGETTQDRVFVAGGIGITPILSIIYSNLENARPFNMTLFYGVRTREDLAFHKLFEFLSERHSHFKYYPILSDDSTWNGDKGILNMDFVRDKLGIISDQLFFICGPDVMTYPMLKALDEMSVAEENIHMEKFVSPESFDENQIPEQHVWVSWLGEKYEYKGNKNLLTFLESQGQQLPYACRAGVCGSCKCRINGKFKMLTNAGLTREEQKQGLALACVSFPESDIEVESPGGARP